MDTFDEVLAEIRRTLLPHVENVSIEQILKDRGVARILYFQDRNSYRFEIRKDGAKRLAGSFLISNLIEIHPKNYLDKMRTDRYDTFDEYFHEPFDGPDGVFSKSKENT